jgi:hypothetical protein
MKHNGTNLDQDALNALKTLKRQDDHQLNTSEARTLIGIDDNDYMRRRFRKLENAGLVDIDEDTRSATPIPPKRATLTDEGIKKAESWDLDPDGSDIRSPEHRLERVERRLDDVHDRLDEIEAAATDHPESMPDLLETRRLVATLNDYVVMEMDADLGQYYPVEE